MTSEQTFFHLYKFNSNPGKDIVADGFFTLIIGKGSISVAPRLTLNFVLHVPELSCNLLYISKLTKSLNHVIFYPNCIFQDLTMGKRIGSAKEKEGLYYLDFKTKENGPGYVSKVSKEYEEQIWLLHTIDWVTQVSYLLKLCIRISLSMLMSRRFSVKSVS